MKSATKNEVPSLVVIISGALPADIPATDSGVGETLGIVYLVPVPGVPTGFGATGLVTRGRSSSLPLFPAAGVLTVAQVTLSSKRLSSIVVKTQSSSRSSLSEFKLSKKDYKIRFSTLYTHYILFGYSLRKR